ncbi:MAG TPA: pitrilysin family protein [Thermoanaerobaculia bacterium]
MRTTRTAVALALALGLVASVATAQTQSGAPRQTPPPPQPAKDIRFPAFEQKTLGNGLRVVVVEQHETPAVSVQLLVHAGKAYGPPAKAGIAATTAALLREGTQTRSSQQIAEAIDSVGGFLSSGATADTATAMVSVTSDQIDLGLELLADVALRPTFPAEEIERWRRQTLSGLQVQQESAPYLANAAFERVVFGDHPYGLPETGTPESVQGITRDDLIAFHRERWVPNGAILAVVGDVQPADAFSKVERAFGSWAKGKEPGVPKLRTVTPEKPRVIVIDKPDAVQTEIRAGHVGMVYTDPDFFTSQIYNSILGVGGSARLFQEIRRKRGLSYGASSTFFRAYEPGFFRASTFTKTETTADALGVLLDVVRGLEEAPVPTDELESRKTFLTGAFPFEIETPQGIAGKVLEAMKYGLGREYLESYRDRLAAVTAPQIQDFAKRRVRLHQGLIVLVGNASAFREALEKKVGPVEVIPYKEVDLLRTDLRKAK